MAAAFTGFNCFDYKGHITGPNYSIQGNILLGPSVLSDMEENFLNTEGCLAEKLMAAMQGAKVVGADTRCASNGTSSMFAFLKVAKPDDDPANPHLRIFVSYNDDGTEPIDSLQARFDEVNDCVSSVVDVKDELSFTISPNPSFGEVTVQFSSFAGACRVAAFDVLGKRVGAWPSVFSGDEIKLEMKGLFLMQLTDKKGRKAVKRVLVK